MVSFQDVHLQNDKITELSNVFLYLVQDRAMCDTQIACDLFFDYSQKVKEHIELVDKKMCGRLISSPDLTVRNTADRFLSGSTEIKKIFAEYLKDWCMGKQRQLAVGDHETFLKDTEEMFSIVMNRIQRETEHLYPLVRSLDDGGQLAA